MCRRKPYLGPLVLNIYQTIHKTAQTMFGRAVFNVNILAPRNEDFKLNAMVTKVIQKIAFSISKAMLTN